MLNAAFERDFAAIANPDQVARRILSGTFSARGADLNEASQHAILTFLQRLAGKDLFIKAGIVKEKGSRGRWLHLQFMAVAMIVPTEAAANKLSDMFHTYADLPPCPGTAWNIVFRIRAENGDDLTEQTQFGCAAHRAASEHWNRYAGE